MKRIPTMITICEHYYYYYYYVPRALEREAKKQTTKRTNNNNNKYQKRVSLARRNFSFVDNNGLYYRLMQRRRDLYRPTPISCEKIIILRPTG